MNRKKTLFLLLIPALLFLGFIGFRAVHWKWLGRQSAKKQLQLETTWRQNEFFSLKNDRGFLLEEVGSRLAEYGDRLNRSQINALAQMVTQELVAYSSDSSTEYAKFRFPVSDKDSDMFLDLNWLNYKRERLVAHGISPKSTGDPLADCVEVSRQFFDLARGLTTNTGEKRYCTGCWTDVSFKRMRVTLMEVTSDNIPTRSLVFQDGNISLTTVTASAVYDARGVLKKEKKVQYVLIHFIVRTSGKHDVYPVYTTAFWHPRYGQWLPREMTVPTIEGGTEVLLF
jgi:hypothetical protein